MKKYKGEENYFIWKVMHEMKVYLNDDKTHIDPQRHNDILC